MLIDPASDVYPYLQLAAILRGQIERGEITSALPSLTTLTGESGLSVGTVRRAVAALIGEGLVHTVPGRGTFVTRYVWRDPSRVVSYAALDRVQDEADAAFARGHPGSRAWTAADWKTAR